jgi:hypothetical protein
VSVHEWIYGGTPLTGVDEHGVRWTVEKSTGWSGGAGVRLDRQVKAQQAGEWRSKGQRAAREVVLTGKAWAPDHAALEAAGRRFAAVPLADTLTGISEGVTLTADVSLLDAPAFDHLHATVGSWQLAVVAHDPLLYGPETFGSTGLAGNVPGTGRIWPREWPRDWGVPPGVTPGAIALPNTGRAAYWPRLRISGPVPNPVVSMVETGDWIRWEGELEPGQWLDIDCGNRRVLLNGQVSVRNRVTSSGSWLAVPEGGASLTWTADAANPEATLSVWGHESAWL